MVDIPQPLPQFDDLLLVLGDQAAHIGFLVHLPRQPAVLLQR